MFQPEEKGICWLWGGGVAGLQKFHLSFCSPLPGQLQLQGWGWQQVLARLAAA